VGRYGVSVEEIQLNDPQTLYLRWEDSQWSPFTIDLSTDQRVEDHLDTPSPFRPAPARDRRSAIAERCDWHAVVALSHPQLISRAV
jgi:hypothetical protein